MTSLNESEPESNSIDEEDLKATTPHADSMAYLAALNAVNLILLDTVSFQRNNHIAVHRWISSGNEKNCRWR